MSSLLASQPANRKRNSKGRSSVADNVQAARRIGARNRADPALAKRRNQVFTERPHVEMGSSDNK